MNVGTEQTERGLAGLVGKMADGFSRLVSQHLTLARLELAEDVRAVGKDVASIAAFVPFVLVGYLFLCGAVAVWLAPALGQAQALAVVSAANLLLGGLGIWRALSRLKARRVMDGTAEELSRSVAVLATAGQPAAPPPHRNVLREPPHAR